MLSRAVGGTVMLYKYTSQLARLYLLNKAEICKDFNSQEVLGEC